MAPPAVSFSYYTGFAMREFLTGLRENTRCFGIVLSLLFGSLALYIGTVHPMLAISTFGMPTVLTNGALQALGVVDAPWGVMRRGVVLPGDAETLTFTYSSAKCAQHSGAGDTGSCVPSHDGGSWRAVIDRPIDPRQFGADPNGVADSSVAFSDAVLAAQSTGNPSVLIPCGNYLITGVGLTSSTEVMLITAPPFTFLGAGKGCVSFNGTLANTFDLIHVKPTVFSRGFDIGNFTDNISGGKNIVDLDSGSNNVASIADAKIHDIFALSATPSNAGIFAIATTNNANGVLLNSDIYNNVLNAPTTFSTAGIYLQQLGDSVRIQNNILTGNGYGIYTWGCHPNGCAGEYISGNNITALTAAIRIDGGYRPVIAYNEIELAGASGTSVVVEMAGSDQPVANPAILYNTIHCVGSCSGVTALIEIFGGTNATTNATVEGNDLSSSQAGVTGIAILSGATGTRVAPNNLYQSLGTNVSDAGTGSAIGVTCSGSPTASFAASLGMVTHC